jgi:hypothetical protein
MFLSIVAAASAVLSTACGGNEFIPAPTSPDQKTSFRPEDPRKYDIRALNQEVAEKQQSLYEAQRNLSLDFACIADANWEVKSSDPKSVTAKIGGPKLDPNEARAVDTTFSYFGSAFKKLQDEYARFQDFRRLYDGAPHDQRLLRVAIQQGFAALFLGRKTLELAKAFEAERCSLRPLQSGLKIVGDTVSDIAQGQLPGLVRLVDDGSDHWGAALLTIQLAVFTGQDALTPCGTATKDLANASTNFDTSIFAWCGYAAASVGQTEQAQKYWAQAGQSVHDPEGASYALARVRDAGQAPAIGKVKVTPLKAE